MRPVKQRRRIFLREWRAYRNKTQAQVAEAVGVTKTHISNIENAKRQYTQVLLEAIADYLECEPSHLLNIDPTDPDGLWSIWELAQRVPAGKRGDARRIMAALAGPPEAQPSPPPPPGGARRRAGKR